MSPRVPGYITSRYTGRQTHTHTQSTCDGNHGYKAEQGVTPRTVMSLQESKEGMGIKAITPSWHCCLRISTLERAILTVTQSIFTSSTLGNVGNVGNVLLTKLGYREKVLSEVRRGGRFGSATFLVSSTSMYANVREVVHLLQPLVLLRVFARGRVRVEHDHVYRTDVERVEAGQRQGATTAKGNRQ